MIVVSDTSPISNLIIVGQIDLLVQLFGSVVIPTAVYQELLNNGEDHVVSRTIQTLSWLEVRSVSNLSQVDELRQGSRLDPGEANAIVLALELKATQLLIDERLGRAEAKRLGLRITGILGVLLAAKERGLVASVRPTLDRLINEANFRISRPLYDEVLVLAKEVD